MTIIACGVQVARALEAAKILSVSGISPLLINMSSIKPIDRDLIIKAAKRTGAVVTAEDHSIIGGLGSAVAVVLVQETPVPMEFVGTQDVFGESGEPDELAINRGLSPSYS